VSLNDAVAVTVGDDATGVATAGDRRGSGPVRANVALNEECIEALTCSPATGSTRRWPTADHRGVSHHRI